MATLPLAIGLGSGLVFVLITVVTLPIAAIAFARSGTAWRQIGKGPFALEHEPPPKRTDAAAESAVQATEARQMIEAKAYRRHRRGEAPLDVDAELSRVLGTTAGADPREDVELRAEVRRLVIARNERRVRRGEPPLDVDAETERQLADLVASS